MCAFDVLQVSTSIHVVVSADGVLYHATISLQTIGYDHDTSAVLSLPLESSTWSAINNNLGKKDISYIKMCTSQNSAGYRIVVGSAEQSKAGVASAYYHVDPSPAMKDAAWKPAHLPEAASEVLSLQPAATTYSVIPEGVFALYRQKSGNTRLAMSGFKSSGDPADDIPMDESQLGEVRDIYASVNPWR